MGASIFQKKKIKVKLDANILKEMDLEINWRPDVGKKVEEFFEDSGYKEYLESAVSFNRKLNEERKMRLPYIDSQTGVAQRHYDTERNKRERMPGMRQGQIYAYPQKQWRKKSYQYLKFFMKPKRSFDPDAEMHTISQIENPSAMPGSGNIPPNEDSNTSDKDGKEWPYYDEDGFMDEDEERNSDSDFEYEDSFSKKQRRSQGAGGGGGGRRGGGRGSRGRSNVSFGASGSSNPTNKRRTHADNIPDSEKPFSCELCGARYKTRPGLSYHYNHSHKEKGPNDPIPTSVSGMEELAHEEGVSAPSSVGGSSITPPSTPGLQESSIPQMEIVPGGPAAATGSGSRSRRPGGGSMAYNRDEPSFNRDENSQHSSSPLPMPSRGSGPLGNVRKIMVDGKERAVSLGYCDFCLGDANENKKTGKPEEMCSCAECGRSGHPSCLQFTNNMIVSVRQYAWQCIECKTCTLCGTSENDDQLLFCDDCDRGYHMYCLVPPIKEPPEGSWSCKLCIERFHQK